MFHVRKRMVLGLLAGLLAVSMAMPVYAAKRKKISSVTLDIKAEILPDTDYGDELIEINATSNKFSVDGYEVLNDGFGWFADSVPEIRITLTADDDYYFTSLSKDKIVLRGGATFEKATRQDSSSTLLLDVKLSSLQNTMKELDGVTLSEEGIATWTPVANAGSYEVRVYRGTKPVGTNLIAQSGIMNCRERMVKGGETYSVKVRPVNQLDPENKGEWKESGSVFISNEKAAEFRENPQGGSGRWEQQENGGWKYIDSDDAYAANGWQNIGGKWYFFNEEGIMQTGWIKWEGKEYYCSENGDMLTSCLTPDSYQVGADGAKIEMGGPGA
ncbi:MAG: N-acetylmuramoyl-L-alanine amidase family protein [Enterocloster sp.]